MSIKKITNSVRYLILAIALAPNLVHAQSSAATKSLENLKTVGTKAGYSPEATDLKMTVASIIQALLGFVGWIFFILILWGGFQWMTSGGNEQKIEAAKSRITSASIGLALVLTSYAIASFIASSLGNAV